MVSYIFLYLPYFSFPAGYLGKTQLPFDAPFRELIIITTSANNVLQNNSTEMMLHLSQ
jgi:hypothetical protein